MLLECINDIRYRCRKRAPCRSKAVGLASAVTAAAGDLQILLPAVLICKFAIAEPADLPRWDDKVKTEVYPTKLSGEKRQGMPRPNPLGGRGLL